MRPSSPRRRGGLVAVVLAALPMFAGIALAAAKAASAAPAVPRHVLIVAMSGITWEDAAAGRVSELDALGERWSMGALAVRTVDSPTDPASAFLTIGAGNRARGRQGGRGLTPAQWSRIVEANARLHFGAIPGSFGDALHRHGLRTAVVGAPGDLGLLALADRSGTVDITETSPPGNEAAGAGYALAAADVVLVDLQGGAGNEDGSLYKLLRRVDLGRDTILAIGIPTADGSPERLMAAVGAGVGMERGGWLTSATTRRNGVVTLPDIAPAILHLLGIDPPMAMTGQALHAAPASARAGRLPVLLGLQRAAAAYRQRVAPFAVAVAVLAVAVFLLGWHALRRDGPSAGPARRAAALIVVAAPVACLLQVAAGAERWSTGPATGVLAGADAVIVALALAGPWRRRPAGGPVFVATLTVAALAADLLTGARGQLSSLIGYSPVEAGRFYGLSAVSFAVLATCVLVLAGMLAGVVPRHAVAVVVGLGAITTAVAGAPMLGAKLGSILTLVPAFGLLVLLVSGRRLSFGRLALLAAAAAVVALGAGLVDLLRPAPSRTHIGRFVASLLGGGPGSVSDVVARKAGTNLGIFVRAPIAAAVPLALVFVAVAVLRPPAFLAGPLGQVPGLRVGLLSAIAANALALFVNDSGVAIPAMGLAVGVPLAVAVLLGSPPVGNPVGSAGSVGIRRIVRAERARGT